LEGAVVNARGLLADEGRLEEDLGGARTFFTDGNMRGLEKNVS
jgi:hypothetical protein